MRIMDQAFCCSGRERCVVRNVPGRKFNAKQQPCSSGLSISVKDCMEDLGAFLEIILHISVLQM